MNGRSDALIEVGDTFTFNGLRGQETNPEVRLRIDGVTVSGNLNVAISAHPDEQFQVGILSVPILTALDLIETNVWQEEAP